MVCCKKCINCETTLLEKEIWYICQFDGWVIPDDMVNNGECDAYVEMGGNDTKE